MLRFIIQQHEVDGNIGLEHREFITIDADVPEIEALLKSGGRGSMGFKICSLVGVEILEASKSE